MTVLVAQARTKPENVAELQPAAEKRFAAIDASQPAPVAA